MANQTAGALALVTGGAGFIGSHLCEGLLGAGYRVRVLDDFSAGKRENLQGLGDRVEVIAGDVRDAGACREACQGARFVFHQAAVASVPQSMAEPASTIAINVAGMANVLAAACQARASRVIYASSASVYGDSDKMLQREGDEGAPLSVGALSKKLAEELARGFAAAFGMTTIGLRYFNVFGPRQGGGRFGAVIPRFFEACRDRIRVCCKWADGLDLAGAQS